MDNSNWVLALKIIAYWLAWLGIIYLLARRGYKNSGYNWGAYQDYTTLGGIFAVMKFITIYVPITAIVVYLTCLLFKS